MIDDVKLNDNRKYDYSIEPVQFRDEYPIILNMVRDGSKIIDLGCGNGSLLNLLIKKKSCTGIGIDISESGVKACQEKGLMAYCRNIDQVHQDIDDKKFDYAICNVTLQMVMYPEVLLQEMGRIAKYQIISFPNFAYYKNRLDFFLKGRMPLPMLFGYKWYNTGHIHQLSFDDFLQFCREHHFDLLKVEFVGNPQAGWKKFLLSKFPNLFSSINVFLLEAKNVSIARLPS